MILSSNLAWIINQVEFKFLYFITSSSLNIICKLILSSSQTWTFYSCCRAELEHSLLDKILLVYSPTSNWGSFGYPCRLFSNLRPIFSLLHGLDYKAQNCKWTYRNGEFLEAHNQLPQNASQLISIFSHKQIRSHTYWTIDLSSMLSSPPKPLCIIFPIKATGASHFPSTK